MEKNSVGYTKVIKTIRKRYMLALCIITKSNNSVI